MKYVFRSCLVLACMSTHLAMAQAVESQQISGSVADTSGAVVANARVAVTNNATGLTRTVNSNSDGLYTVLNLPVGTYTITPRHPGFKKFIINNVNLDVGAKPAVPIQLAVGDVSQAVEVKADNVMMQTTTAEIGGIITSTEATQIQLNGRNYVQLLTLQPGVSQTVASGFAIFGTYGVNGNSQSVNGIRTDSANYFIDGVDNKDNGGGGNNFVNISPDSLQQFRNVASSYDASYGGTAGATVSVAIKSGGRSFHGNAYEYLRNNAIQAYQFRPLSLYPTPANPAGSPLIKAPLHYNDFGYTFGGPVWIPGVFNKNREKLFFFVGQEFKRLRTSTQQTASVPTPAAIAAAIASTSQQVALAESSTATGRALAATLLTSPGGSFSYLSLGNNNQSEYLVKDRLQPECEEPDQRSLRPRQRAQRRQPDQLRHLRPHHPRAHVVGAVDAHLQREDCEHRHRFPSRATSSTRAATSARTPVRKVYPSLGLWPDLPDAVQRIADHSADHDFRLWQSLPRRRETSIIRSASMR